jgi:hypothetical protein
MIKYDSKRFLNISHTVRTLPYVHSINIKLALKWQISVSRQVNCIIREKRNTLFFRKRECATDNEELNLQFHLASVLLFETYGSNAAETCWEPAEMVLGSSCVQFFVFHALRCIHYHYTFLDDYGVEDHTYCLSILGNFQLFTGWVIRLDFGGHKLAEVTRSAQPPG